MAREGFAQNVVGPVRTRKSTRDCRAIGEDEEADKLIYLMIAGLCLREGKEAFEKAKAKSFACACGGACKTDGN